MKRMNVITATLLGVAPLLLAETSALLEVKFFKDWGIKGEEMSHNFNIAIKNTGTDPIRLFKHSVDFEIGQLAMRPLPRNLDVPEENEKQEFEYRMARANNGGFFELPPEETHVYEGRKFFISQQLPFSEEMRFTVSVYLDKGVWLDSKPVMLKGVTPDSVEKVTTVGDANYSSDLVAVTYKNERWLYSTGGGYYFEICPVSLTNKIRVEPHEGKGRLYKIWDGDKSMIYRDGHSILTEGPDENNVFGKWTRERKQKAEADNAEVRRKKEEEAK
jgi:hypothetical protein